MKGPRCFAASYLYVLAEVQLLLVLVRCSRCFLLAFLSECCCIGRDAAVAVTSDVFLAFLLSMVAAAAGVVVTHLTYSMGFLV